MHTVIGLDLGHSAVKMVVHGNAPFRACFPTIVCPYVDTSSEADAKRASEDTVLLPNGQKLLVGQTALLQNSLHLDNDICLHSDWISSTNYEVLFRAAIRKAQIKGNDLSRLVIVHGLPAKDHFSHGDAIRKVHARVCPDAICLVHAHPLGLYYAYLLDDDGAPVAEHNGLEEVWCLLEVGHFKLDYGVMYKGIWVEPASGSTLGVSDVIKKIAAKIKSNSGPDIKLQKIQEALESGRRPLTVKFYGKDIDITEAVDKTVREWYDGMLQTVFNSLNPYIPSAHGVLLAGGGASLIKPFLEKQWPHLKLLPDSRFTVADGFCRIGRMAAEDAFSPESFTS